MFIPLRLATDARNLVFETSLDMEIDEVSRLQRHCLSVLIFLKISRRAAYAASGLNSEAIDRHMRENPSGDNHWGMVVGDEARLRQIVTNLARWVSHSCVLSVLFSLCISNACKFTSTGGKLSISTSLVSPPPSGYSGSTLASNKSIPVRPSDATAWSFDPAPMDSIVVRIEVSDTGSGLRAEDLAESKLFCRFAFRS